MLSDAAELKISKAEEMSAKTIAEQQAAQAKSAKTSAAQHSSWWPCVSCSLLCTHLGRLSLSLGLPWYSAANVNFCALSHTAPCLPGFIFSSVQEWMVHLPGLGPGLKS